MTDKPWKAFERYVAKALGAQRIPVLGREDSDISPVDGLWIDAKLRLEVPKQYFSLIESAEMLGYNTLTLEEGQFGIMRLSVFSDPDKLILPVSVITHYPKKGIEWLEHISASAPQKHLPGVVMLRPRMPYREAIVLAKFSDFFLYREKKIVERGRVNAAAG